MLRPLFLSSLAFLAAVSALANTALKPEPRDPNWVKRHDGFVQIAKQGGVDVLFVGDSITDGWRRLERGGGKATWDREFAPLKSANFGISGDRTQHVLWRLENGELDGFKPKAIVLMIGTNNTG
ncbi:MAG: GDSL-type esterase/lipase family protein, partial [Verrucomicrobiota bacterium]